MCIKTAPVQNLCFHNNQSAKNNVQEMPDEQPPTKELPERF
jgi:hypothetical protein